MRRKLTGIAGTLVAFLLLFAGGTICYADTVTLYFDHVGGSTDATGQYYIYPYYFDITDNGTTTNNVALICTSFNRETNPGQTWTATEVKASTNVKYELAAYLLFQALYRGGDMKNTQLAIWWLFDTGDSKLAALMTQGAYDLAGESLSSAELAQFADDTIYVGPDDKQIFLASPVPEPGTLALLGSGLLGLATLLYFTRRSGVRAS